MERHSRPSILVVCVHNSGRSQLAEAYLRRFGGDRLRVRSAGSRPRPLNPLVVDALRDDGIDIRGKQPVDVRALHDAGARFDYVIGVCDREALDVCPVFPAERRRLHWPFPDPAALTGGDAERLAAVRELRDRIRERCRLFCAGLA